jgi:hypothetical protein
MRKNILTILLFSSLVNYITAQSWSPVGSGIVPGPDYYRSVRSIATCHGELYAGGYFDSAGNIPTKNIAKWNGNNWSAVNQGIDGIVNALTVYNGQLFAGGDFSTAGSIAANDIAMWNGTNWSNVGNIEAYYGVKAMVVYNGELYAGGWFLNPGPDGTPIVRWNGTNWTSAGLEDSLYMISIDCMTVYNGELYAAGAYYAIGGGGVPEYYRIIKWNGIGWNNLATIPGIYTLDGALGNILSMTVYNGELFIAGTFSIMIDTITTAYQIAKWNGTNWSSVGTGINPEAYPICCDYGDGSSYSFVKSMAVYNGALYATGRFDSCGAIATNNIAKWNGTNWTNMNQGINGPGYALLGTDTCLFVGGWFNTVNGNNFLPAKSVAKWKDSCLSSPPTQPINIYGNTTICEGTTQTYSIDSIPGATSYSWILPSGWSGNSNTSVINVIAGNNSGEIKVIAINSCGNSSARTMPVIVNSIPYQPDTIYGNDDVCQGSSFTYIIEEVPDATSYTWSLPSGWTGNSITNSIATIAGINSGIISVFANNNCGSSTPETITIVSNSIPAMPALINGNDTVCEGSSQTYFIDPVPGATGYSWDLTFGWGGSSNTDSITIVVDHNGYFDDLISVSAYNNCGNSDLQILPVRVNLLPQYPNSISGNTTVCRGGVQTYFINPVYGATSYTWILPPGWIGSSNTSSINVTAGNEAGEISVTANNSCGSGAFTSLPIQTDTVLSAPSDITGNVYVNAGQFQSYSINPISGVTGYNWSLNGGGNIISGQNTTKVDVKWQTPGTYVLSANVTNSCGASADQTITIKVSAANIEDPYSLQLFPNPSSGQFFLKAKRVQDKVINVAVVNMTGQFVFRSGKKQGANDYTQPINLDKMAVGLYAVTIMIDDKVFVRSVMIKH